MKPSFIIILILMGGIAAALWLSRRNSQSQFNPTWGKPLSSNALARIRVAGGGGYALAIAPDGSLWSWGNAASSTAWGQGSVRGPVTKPTRVGTNQDWAEINAGYNDPRAVKRDGSLWAWGPNSSGSLGDGTLQTRTTPTRIGMDQDWVKVGAGLQHTVALKRDGSLWAWGANTQGQLGLPSLTNTTNQTFVPMRVGTDNDWKALAVGAFHTVALKSNGTLWTWGDSSVTPAGTTSPSNNYSPVKIGADTNWVAVAAGYYHTAALKEDGTLWNWGRNSHLLGTIPAADPSQPRQVGTNTHWAAIYDGAYHNLARRTDGSFWELGSFTFPGAQKLIPGNWAAVGCGAEFNLAVSPDGSLWHWGTRIGVKTGPGTFRSLWYELHRRLSLRSPTTPAPPKNEVPTKIFQWPAPSENSGVK